MSGVLFPKVHVPVSSLVEIIKQEQREERIVARGLNKKRVHAQEEVGKDSQSPQDRESS